MTLWKKYMILNNLPFSREIPAINQTMKQRAWFTGTMSEPRGREGARWEVWLSPCIGYSKLTPKKSRQFYFWSFLPSVRFNILGNGELLSIVFRISLSMLSGWKMLSWITRFTFVFLGVLDLLGEALDCVFELFPGRLASVATVLWCSILARCLR